MSEIERAHRAHMSTSTARLEGGINRAQEIIVRSIAAPRGAISPSISYGMVERHALVREYGGDCWCPKCHPGNPRQTLAPGPRVPTTKGAPPYPLFTPSGNEDVDEAAIAQDAANQKYLSAAQGSWLPFLVAAAIGIVFLIATPYWAITVLLFFGAAFWAFAWVPTVARRKRWMESRGRYYGAVKHIAELETWHEQNP